MPTSAAESEAPMTTSVFFVTGTDTGVGKTLVAAALTRALRRPRAARRRDEADSLRLRPDTRRACAIPTPSP